MVVVVELELVVVTSEVVVDIEVVVVESIATGTVSSGSSAVPAFTRAKRATPVTTPAATTPRIFEREKDTERERVNPTFPYPRMSDLPNTVELEPRPQRI